MFTEKLDNFPLPQNKTKALISFNILLRLTLNEAACRGVVSIIVALSKRHAFSLIHNSLTTRAI